jgi:hypothetical protein
MMCLSALRDVTKITFFIARSDGPKTGGLLRHRAADFRDTRAGPGITLTRIKTCV